MSSVPSRSAFDPHPGPAPPNPAVARLMVGVFGAVLAVNVLWFVALLASAVLGTVSWTLVGMMAWAPVALSLGSAVGIRCAAGVLRDERCGADPRG
jgi:hypothetical protein